MERQAKNGLDVTMDAQRQADLQRKANIPDPQGGRNILQRQMPSAPLETQESVAETSAKATEKEKPLKKVGDKVSGFSVGDRVVAANSAPCGKCFFCRFLIMTCL